MTTQPNTEPLKVGEASEWFAIAMNAAAAIEDAGLNIRNDPDAKRLALSAAYHVRAKCNELWNRRTEPSPAEVGSEGLPELPKAVGRVMVVEGDESCGDLRVKLPENTRLFTAMQMEAYARQALSQQSPARVEGELTDEKIKEIAAPIIDIRGGSRMDSSDELIEYTVQVVRAALNQRLAVKEGVLPLTEKKTRSVEERGYKITGYVLTHDDGSKAISDMQAVRWLEQREFWNVMHPDSTHPVSDDQQAKDAARLDFLIANELQVWEVNGRYSVHEVTEHHPITEEFSDPRWAIDAALSTTKQEEA